MQSVVFLSTRNSEAIVSLGDVGVAIGTGGELHKVRLGAEDRAAADAEVQAARRNLEAETGDDRETQSRVATASNVIGAWLKGVAASLAAEIAGLDAAVAGLGLDGTHTAQAAYTARAETATAGHADLAEIDPL
jgi:hypothetical protein